MNRFARYCFAALTSACLLSAGDVRAAGSDPLAGQPAVRHRHELRSGRFELGPSFGLSLNRSYRQAVLFGAKLEYHINDYLSVGGEVSGAVSYDASLTSEIEQSYASAPAEFDELRKRMSDIKMAADLRLCFTPFAGKMAIFSALFLAYDFYIFGGFGMVILGNGFEVTDPLDDVDATNEGFRPGMAMGLGTHLYINRWIALGIEVKNLMFSDNETGGDLTRGLTAKEQELGGIPIVDGDDTSFGANFFFGLNVTFLLPTEIKISD